MASRRQRKRRKPSNDCELECVFHLDDSPPENPPKKSVNQLLLERELFGNRRHHHSLLYQKPRVFRPYCKRTINFSDLKVSYSDAILDLDDTGNALIALCEDEDSYKVKLYAVPSCGKSTLFNLLTIPLPLSEEWPFEHPVSAPARVFTRILKLDDLCVVVYRQDRINVYAVVQGLKSSHILRNVHSPSHCTKNHALYRVSSVPVSTEVFEQGPSYLFLLDEDDGFRLTYLRHNLMHVQEKAVEPFWEDGKKVFRKNLRMIMEDGDPGWECTQSGDYSVVGTRYLNVVVLLFDILTRLPHLVKPRFDGTVLPTFRYHCVKLRDRTLFLLIVASIATTRGVTGKGCFGIFCEVDLLTGDYRIVQCVRTKKQDIPGETTMLLARARQETTLSCLVVDNERVIRGRPVASLVAQSGPVELTYDLDF